jgi:hypothetical protein
MLRLDPAYVSSEAAASRQCNPPSGALQISPLVSDLALYDIVGTPGVAADISHINSRAITKVTAVLRVVSAQLPGAASRPEPDIERHLFSGLRRRRSAGGGAQGR